MSDPTIAPSAWKIQQALAVAQAFAARLREAEPDLDEDTLLLALSSETEAETLLNSVLRAGEEAATMAEAIKARIDALTTRHARYTKRKADARATAFAIMDALGVAKFTSPEFTATIRGGAASVVVTDEAALPDFVMRQPPPAPDKAAILKMLKAGQTLPGAELANGMPTLSVRTN